MKIVIDLPPESKERPHFSNGHAYTPQKTRDYENAVRLIARAQIREKLHGAVSAEIDFYMPIPKSWTKAKQEQAMSGEIRPTVKSDIDNLCKAIFDALNGIAYDDDKQIVELTARKFYGEPRTEIWLQNTASI